MYRLTIDQVPPSDPYIVADFDTIEDAYRALKDYKNRLEKENRLQLFTHYDIIEFNDVYEDSYTLDIEETANV